MQPIELKVNDLLAIIGHKEAILVHLSSQLQASMAEIRKLKAELATALAPKPDTLTSRRGVAQDGQKTWQNEPIG